MTIICCLPSLPVVLKPNLQSMQILMVEDDVLVLVRFDHVAGLIVNANHIVV
jgi:hypothetical protein